MSFQGGFTRVGTKLICIGREFQRVRAATLKALSLCISLIEGESDGLPRISVGENPRGWVLHILEPVRGFAGDPKQDPNVVVQVEGDECMVIDDDLR